MKLTFVKKDPDKGYYGRQLWIPKKHVNTAAVKAGLEFPVPDEEFGISFLQLWEDSSDHLIVPREFIPREQYRLLEFPIISTQPTSFNAVRFKSSIVLDKLQPDIPIQKNAFTDMLNANNGGILNLSCGKGKTIIALQHIVHKEVTALVIVNNTTLIDQWKERIAQFLDVEGGVGTVQGPVRTWDWEGRGIVLAMLQSLALRYDQLPVGFDKYFGGIYYDECFPAGTLVDGNHIELLRIGDRVRSYDQSTGHIVLKPITNVFKSLPTRMARIHIDGKVLHCTPGHPFLTAAGWVSASDLRSGDYVKGVNGAGYHDKMHNVQQTCGANEQTQKVRLQENGESLLQQTLYRRSVPNDLVRDNESNKSGTVRHTVGTDEKVQSSVRQSPPEAHTRKTEETEAKTTNTRRQRQRHSVSTTPSVRSATEGIQQVDTRARSHNQQTKRSGVSEPLQIGHSTFNKTRQCRGGRQLPLSQGEKASGQQEDDILTWTRVDSVEILESGSDPTFGGVCPDGYVYNIEVAESHTYIVHDLIVHNCHHMAAPMFSRVAPLFYGKRYGLTATVNREDGLEPIYQYHLGNVFHRNLVQDLRPRIYFQETSVQLDMRNPAVKDAVTDTRGKFCIPKLRSYLGSYADNNDFIADKLREPIAAGRKILVLSHSVAQLRNLVTMFPDAGLCTGEESPALRIEVLKHKQITFGTLQLVREALDEQTLDTLFFLTPFGSSSVDMGGKNTLQQGMGRILRHRDGKKTPVVVIIDHIFIPVLHRMCRKLKHLLHNWPVDESGPYEYQLLKPFENAVKGSK